MKFFLDSAHYGALIKAKETGLLEGVTTNPSLLSKEGRKPVELIKKISQLIAPYDVSVEVTEKDSRSVYSQAHAIAALGSNVVVKIPCHPDYLPVIAKLTQEGVPLNITLMFSAIQGLCMAKLKVKYISPYIGRLDDIDCDGLEVIKDLRHMLDLYCYETQILAASIRSVRHIHDAALMGADCATIPFELFEHMLDHPLTDKGIDLFDKDWKRLAIDKFP
jgi:transaldolase